MNSTESVLVPSHKQLSNVLSERLAVAENRLKHDGYTPDQELLAMVASLFMIATLPIPSLPVPPTKSFPLISIDAILPRYKSAKYTPFPLYYWVQHTHTKYVIQVYKHWRSRRKYLKTAVGERQRSVGVIQKYASFGRRFILQMTRQSHAFQFWCVCTLKGRIHFLLILSLQGNAIDCYVFCSFVVIFSPLAAMTWNWFVWSVAISCHNTLY